MGKLGDLHLVKVQCATNTLVHKVKLVERCFDNGTTVEFEMYETAPAAPPAPLPYFVKAGGEVATDEDDLAFYLAEQGAKHLLLTDDPGTVRALFPEFANISKAVKAAGKSKNAEAMAKNKVDLFGVLQETEAALSKSDFLARDSLSLADLLLMANLRPAFEKVLDPSDRSNTVPALTAWYERCYKASEAVQKVWKGELVLCEESVVEGKKPKESKEEKKAREKARKKEAEAAKKADKTADKATASGRGGDKRHEEALTPREEDFSKWYSEIVVKAELLSYYDVSGCYILRPNAFAMWESIQAWFDAKIKTDDVENCMFPLFITEDVLNKEKEHVEDFAPEVAWVTRSGNSELEKPLAIRPTSETAMYPYYAQWIRSHRDLPLKLNQWTNVVRWEFKHPTPFIRSREFLWQEGHTAHATEAEAQEQVMLILGWYQGIYEELLAVPVIRGRKSKKEKFAGADNTTTVEAFIPDTGKGIQGATSHCLGQNFSKMFGISYLNEAREDVFAWQTSWGCTTRTIGVMIMTHSDSRGLVTPPRVAPKQAVIVPIAKSEMSDVERQAMADKATELAAALKAAGVRAHADLRDNYNPGFKYAQWEMRGACVRIELGPKDMQNESAMMVRRDTGAKEAVPWARLPTRLPEVLEQIQADMFARAKERVSACRATVFEFEEFKAALAAKKCILAPWCDEVAVEEEVRKVTAKKASEETGEGGEAGAKTLCIPFDQPPMPAGQMCIFSKVLLGVDRPAKNFALWGRSY